MSDVVAAAATPWGHSAIAVVRLSGDPLDHVIERVVVPLNPGPWVPNRTRRCRLVDAEGPFDDGLIVVGRAPSTYTGEDTAEISCHGNPYLVERLLAALQAAGARVARPGEFTRRALENGKLDLVRAEAVLQVVEASSPAGLAVGRAGLDGRLSEAFTAVRQEIVEVTAELEARLDYPGDELAVNTDEELVRRLRDVQERCGRWVESHRAGRVLVDGARVALVGAVNAGKSSLFNRLVDEERALVHDTPGTTRDVLEVRTRLGRVPVTLLDTAGERPTDDPVEAAGLALAQRLIGGADLLLVVLRASSDGPSAAESEILERTATANRIVVYNGVDRADVGDPPSNAVATSATTGAGVEDLVAGIEERLVGDTPGHAGLIIASAHQRDRLRDVIEGIDRCVDALPVAGVAVAADALTEALESLDELTGVDTRESVLDALFARFCIGK